MIVIILSFTLRVSLEIMIFPHIIALISFVSLMELIRDKKGKHFFTRCDYTNGSPS